MSHEKLFTWFEKKNEMKIEMWTLTDSKSSALQLWSSENMLNDCRNCKIYLIFSHTMVSLSIFTTPRIFAKDCQTVFYSCIDFRYCDCHRNGFPLTRKIKEFPGDEFWFSECHLKKILVNLRNYWFFICNIFSCIKSNIF